MLGQGLSIRVTLFEGRNRQIRKMCEEVGLEVARLKRTAVGSIKLGMLKQGDWRDLTEDEVRNIIYKANKRLEDILANDRTKISDDSFGELIPFNLFSDYVVNGSIHNDDGIGYYATETEKSRLQFKFFDFDDENKLKKYKFTHIMWYNK